MVAVDEEIDILVNINIVFPRGNTFFDMLVYGIQTGIIEIEQFADRQFFSYGPGTVLQPSFKNRNYYAITDKIRQH